MATVNVKFVGECTHSWRFSKDKIYEVNKDGDGDAFIYDDAMKRLYVDRVCSLFVGVVFDRYAFEIVSHDIMSTTYRVVAECRKSGKQTVAYMGNSATLATNSYEALVNKPDFHRDFRVTMQRLDPVIVMESD